MNSPGRLSRECARDKSFIIGFLFVLVKLLYLMNVTHDFAMNSSSLTLSRIVAMAESCRQWAELAVMFLLVLKGPLDQFLAIDVFFA